MADCICVRRGDGPEGCGICNETGTTPDIASLCERLRKFARNPWQPGYLRDTSAEAADTIERQAAEIERLRGAVAEWAERIDAITWTVNTNTLDGLISEMRRAALTGEDA